mmetsp:Transcript_28544/g.52079  ORF Transcript_28544/g.52079 Transcript_28544/m.52079 type:complete len:239 (-) Transcript_28544:155-871(-)
MRPVRRTRVARPRRGVPVLVPHGGRYGGRRAEEEEVGRDDANRNAVLPEGEDGNDGENNGERGGDDETAGLFPKTGGYYGRDLAVHLLHRRFLSSLRSTAHAWGEVGSVRDSHDEWSRRSGETDASVFLNVTHCGAISALLEPLAAGRETAEARSACAATGSSSPSSEDRSSGSATLLPLHIAAIPPTLRRLLPTIGFVILVPSRGDIEQGGGVLRRRGATRAIRGIDSEGGESHAGE